MSSHYGGVALGLFGVVAADEPVRQDQVPQAALDLLDPQGLCHGAVAPGPGQRRGGLVALTWLLGLDVLPAAGLQGWPKGTGVPSSVPVLWSTKDKARVVSLSSAGSAEVFGDGAPVQPRTRRVQGTTATEIVNNGVSLVTWKQPGATRPCTFWSVVSTGLSQRELAAVLASVREAS